MNKLLAERAKGESVALPPFCSRACGSTTLALCFVVVAFFVALF